MFLETLERAGKPHGGRIIKVFASEADPRQIVDQPELTVVEVADHPFGLDEIYEYPGYRVYSGPEIEGTLAGYGLDDRINRMARSLFRFANEQGFCQAAMAARWEDGTGIKHPLEDIDGLPPAERPVSTQDIHLDIFFPRSLVVLKEVVDYDDPTKVLSMRDSLQRRKPQLMPRPKLENP